MWQYAKIIENFTCLGLFEGTTDKLHDDKKITTLQIKLTQNNYVQWAHDLERMKLSTQGEIDDLVRDIGESAMVDRILVMI